MSHDLQMARATGPGYNLAIGEPFFLQAEFLDKLEISTPPKKLLYPSVGGEPELVVAIRDYMLRTYNMSPEHVVVTNGCKQAIAAAFYAFADVERRHVVVHGAPYWASYPTLAQSIALEFNSRGPKEALVSVVTSPNNPDGWEPYPPKTPYDLWDAAYAHEVYGWSGVAPIHRVSVWSAAKLFGGSGLRVGWLATDDAALAAKAAYHVEVSTSGVSTPSQMHLLGILNGIRARPEDTKRLYRLAARVLEENADSFNDLVADHCARIGGLPASGRGMFAWFQARDPEAFASALVRAQVKLVTGEACGVYGAGWYRMSLGHEAEYTRKALTKLDQEIRASSL